MIANGKLNCFAKTTDNVVPYRLQDLLKKHVQDQMTFGGSFFILSWHKTNLSQMFCPGTK